MKKYYKKPSIDEVFFGVSDVIITSDPVIPPETQDPYEPGQG